MELKRTLEKAVPLLKKYRLLLFVLLVGIILLSLPQKSSSKEQEVVPPVRDSKAETEEHLSDILRKISGAGDVAVLLTEEAGERTVYQMDSAGENARQDTVIVTGTDRSQRGLIQQIRSPEYRGAVVVCQGADDPNIRLAIVEAVSNVTGLGSDRISVLKMK